jgi:hypothetical protein
MYMTTNSKCLVDDCLYSWKYVVFLGSDDPDQQVSLHLFGTFVMGTKFLLTR